jgi:hypothetical protein
LLVFGTANFFVLVFYSAICFKPPTAYSKLTSF